MISTKKSVRKEIFLPIKLVVEKHNSQLLFNHACIPIDCLLSYIWLIKKIKKMQDQIRWWYKRDINVHGNSSPHVDDTSLLWHKWCKNKFYSKRDKQNSIKLKIFYIV